MSPSPVSVAELFRRHLHPDGREYTPEEVADLVAQRYRRQVSPQAIIAVQQGAQDTETIFLIQLCFQPFAALLDQLFRTIRDKQGREYSYAEIARRMQERAGVSIAPSTIGRYRAGVIGSPSRETIMLFAQAFDVPPLYFFPEYLGLDADDPRSQIQTALRTLGVEPEVIAHLLGIIKAIQGH